MTHDSSNIISVPPPGGDFTLGPYLDTVYRWAEAQSWCQPELEAGWKFYAQPGPQDAPGLPDAKDPDAHDRLLRFWSWFALERKLGEGDRPIDRFLAAHAKDLTAEGRATYEGLARSVFGAFKVAKTMPGRLVVLEGLAEGDAHSIPDRALANELQKGDLVVGRLYPFQDAYLADPDVHIGDMHEAPPARRITAPEAEAEYYTAMVPSKGHVMDVIDALLVQIDSPLTADDVFEMIKAAEALGLRAANEVFADRSYQDDGSLSPRGLPGAMIEDPDQSLAQVRQ
ncbi:MAG: LamB/YcsF family protein, partial [Candidatus Sericytochromatia bacterium]